MVPDPWENRDCLGGLLCYTQILRSPEFFLDASGDLSIDMIGGGANGEAPFDPDLYFANRMSQSLCPNSRVRSELQGFALLDVESNQLRPAWVLEALQMMARCVPVIHRRAVTGKRSRSLRRISHPM